MKNGSPQGDSRIKPGTELLRILKSIQYIKETPGQACPVDWKYGDQILYSHSLKSRVYFKTLYSNK
jgi:alkyl hydroperoxide reductase subunit AhpC